MPPPTDLHIALPALGFGTATQGGLFEAVGEAQAHEVFTSAWTAGLRYFDTAPWYGFGQAEDRLGTFLRGRDGAVVSSKVGRLLRADVAPHPSQAGAFVTDGLRNVVYDYSYDGVLRSVEESLLRLGLERLDIAFIHDPDIVGVSVRELMNGAHRALTELRDQGVVRAFGAGMNQWQLPLELARAGDFEVFLLAGRYTLLEQTSAPFMDYCAEAGIKVVVGGVYNSGLLVDPQPDTPYDYVPVPGDVLARALALQAVCTRHDVPLAAAALQFPLAHPAVSTVLTAARTSAQLEANLVFAATPLPDSLWEELKAEGLLATAAPVPTAQRGTYAG